MNGSTCARQPMASNRSAALASSSTGIICGARIKRSAGGHRTRLTSANRRRRHGPPDAMPRSCEFGDSRLCRSPPDRASAVPYGLTDSPASGAIIARLSEAGVPLRPDRPQPELPHQPPGQAGENVLRFLLTLPTGRRLPTSFTAPQQQHGMNSISGKGAGVYRRTGRAHEGGPACRL